MELAPGRPSYSCFSVDFVMEAHADLSASRLAAVNFCLAIVGTIQVSRILAWQSSHKEGVNVEAEAGEVVEKGKEEVQKGVETVERGVSKGVEGAKGAAQKIGGS